MTWRRMTWRRMAGVAGLVLTVLGLRLEPGHAMAGNGSVLAAIERRGVVRCGVSFSPGFAANDNNGRPVGFMVDLCRALAAAVLGKADAIEVRRLAKPHEFTAVETGEVDVSFAQTSWTLSRDATYRIDFGPPVFHDEQGIAAWRPADGHRPPAGPLDEGDATICVPNASNAQQTLDELVSRGGRPWTIRPYPTWPDALQAFIGRECTALSNDRAQLTTALHALETPRDRVIITGGLGTREPIAPFVANGDRSWLTVVRWTMHALVLAEDRGITAANAAILRTSGDGESQRLLGGEPATARRLGLPEDWVFQALSQVGNYGEIFTRNLGTASPFGLERGVNRPWSQGGLLFVPVFQ